ncbi:MAG: hypothetical protein IJJ17_04115 [Parasporobacterium sp.]|nr:hypothetical protein [Parasporobacterium sp.]
MKTGKLIAIGLAAACIMVPAFTAMADDAKVNLNAAKAPEEVVIDGSLDEWNLDSVAEITQQEQLVRDEGQWTGPEDLSLNISAMWDEDNLYIGGTIMDDTPFMYREGFPPDMADSLVVFFGTDPAADPERTEYAAEDFRVTMVLDDYYFNTGIDRDMIADDKGFETIGEDGDEQVLDGYECAVEEIDGGYTFEMVIPWSNFSNDEIPVFVPAAGVTTAFELGMFDLDFPCPGVATARMQWAGRSMDVDEDPSLWGTITFVE